MSNAPFSLLRLDHLVLRTADLPRLRAFYESLGCTVARELEAMRMVQLSTGASMIDLVEVDDRGAAEDATGRNLDHFALRIEPFDAGAIVAFCEARGIPVRVMGQPLLGADGFGPAVYLEDPDGNRVELKGPPGP